MQLDAGIATLTLSYWDPRVIWISYNFRAGIQSATHKRRHESRIRGPTGLPAGDENSVRRETKDYPGYLKPHEEVEVASAVDLKAVYTLVCDCHIK